MDYKQSVILIVDDDNRIRQLLSKYLQENDFLVLTAKDAAQARELMSEFVIDLIILDIMMPKETGVELTKDIRKKSNIPILLLTAMGEVGERITGLESGADDYLVKPFEPRELLLRARNIISRVQIANTGNNESYIKIGRMNFNAKTNRLMLGDALISLTSGEANLLSILSTNIGKLMSRQELANLCGGINERSIDVQIIRLRNKIENDPRKPSHLQTIRGLGYVLYS